MFSIFIFNKAEPAAADNKPGRAPKELISHALPRDICFGGKIYYAVVNK